METLIKTNLKLVDGELYRSNGDKVNVHHNNRGYAMVCVAGKFAQVHRVVFYLSNGFTPEEVDHIDGDKYNNSPENLRASNRSLNMGNQKLRVGCIVKYKGVDYHKRTRTYRARIKGKHLGHFECPVKAAEAYDLEAIAIFGEFAKTNKMLGLI